MEYLKQSLDEFRKYDVNYIDQLVSLYNLASDEEINTVNKNMDLQYKNISLLPEDIEDLTLLEFSNLRNYYSQAPNVNLPNFYAYNFDGEKIYFKSKISGPVYDAVEFSEPISEDTCNCEIKSNVPVGISSERNIYVGTYKNKEVTIEWIDPQFGDILDELAVYNDLIEKGIDLPFIHLDFNFYGKAVLVKDRLYSLDDTDLKTEKIYKLGIQILDELKKLHPYGVLNNLSYENVGKDKLGNYYILDYSKFTDTKLFYGYKRTYWNNLWSSQVSETDQVTIAQNDLLELGYLLNYLYCKFLFNTQVSELKIFAKQIEEERTPIIYKYMNEIKQNYNIKISEKMYQTLKNILHEKKK